MREYDYSKLYGLMREKKITQEGLAKAIGINPSTLNGKLKNVSDFTQSEMIAVMQILGKPLREVPNYFFQH